GLFTGDRWRALPRLGVDAIHVTDSVPDARRYASRIVRIQPILPLIEMAVVEPQAGMPLASALPAPAGCRPHPRRLSPALVEECARAWPAHVRELLPGMGGLPANRERDGVPAAAPWLTTPERYRPGASPPSWLR